MLFVSLPVFIWRGFVYIGCAENVHLLGQLTLELCNLLRLHPLLVKEELELRVVQAN